MTKLGFWRSIFGRMSQVKRTVEEATAGAIESDSKRQTTDATARLPKRKVAVLIGYCGTGYHGMQLNPPHKTIEGELFEAFVKAGAISKDNANDPKKSSLIRAARTDKGVHAAGNVVSLKMIIEDPKIVEKINSHLPEQIRVWGYTRTNRGFECRKVCSSRVYEYVLPTYTLMNPRSTTTLGKSIAKSATSSLPEALKKEAEDFWNGVDSELLAKGVSREAIIAAGEEEGQWQAMQHEAKTDAKSGSSNDDAVPKPADEEEETGTPKPARKLIKSVENYHRRNYRALPERIDYLRKALQQYKGVKNFHNFTVGKEFKDPSSTRIMKDLSVSEPFIIDGTQWISIKIHGQSFMLHQIRKMIALAVLVVRTGAPISKVSQLFDPRIIPIPKAPALGLLLEHPVYDGYNQRLAKLGRDNITFAPYKEKIEAFRKKYIYDRIYTQEASENEFQAFFGFVDTYRTVELLDFLLDIQTEGVEEVNVDEDDTEKANENNEG